MCGRFTLTKPPDLITQHFSLPDTASARARPRYNIAPTQTVQVVRRHGEQRALAEVRWGLLPYWSRDPIIDARFINARAETAATRPAFRAAFRERRCLIPADGFYEWQVSGKHKQPWYIQLREQSLFAFGGLWERWQGGDGTVIETCAIVTTTPNELLQPVHDRMPVILRPADYETWLAPGHTPPGELFRPYPAEEMQMHAVAALVNRASLDGPECCARLPGLDSG